MPADSPLPPEPGPSAIGKPLTLLLAGLIMLMGVLGLLALWSHAELEQLLRLLASALLLLLMIAAGLILWQRLHTKS